MGIKNRKRKMRSTQRQKTPFEFCVVIRNTLGVHAGDGDDVSPWGL